MHEAEHKCEYEIDQNVSKVIRCPWLSVTLLWLTAGCECWLTEETAESGSAPSFTSFWVECSHGCSCMVSSRRWWRSSRRWERLDGRCWKQMSSFCRQMSVLKSDGIPEFPTLLCRSIMETSVRSEVSAVWTRANSQSVNWSSWLVVGEHPDSPWEWNALHSLVMKWFTSLFSPVEQVQRVPAEGLLYSKHH